MAGSIIHALSLFVLLIFAGIFVAVAIFIYNILIPFGLLAKRLTKGGRK